MTSRGLEMPPVQKAFQRASILLRISLLSMRVSGKTALVELRSKPGMATKARVCTKAGPDRILKSPPAPSRPAARQACYPQHYQTASPFSLPARRESGQCSIHKGGSKKPNNRCMKPSACQQCWYDFIENRQKAHFDDLKEGGIRFEKAESETMR